MIRLHQRWRLSRIAGASALVAFLAPAGCTVGLSLFNPNLLQGIGLDPALVTPPRGTVVVALQNRTNFDVEFELISTANATNLTTGAASPPVDVVAGGQSNQVIFCPVRMLALGFDDNGEYINTGAFVFENGGTVEVPYVGSILLAGRDFQCGDVIRFTLEPDPNAGGGNQDGDGEGDGEGQPQNAYRFIVEIIPSS